MLCGGVACLAGGVLSDELVKRTGWRRLGRAVFPICGCLVAAAAMLAIPHVNTQRDATILMCVAAAAFDFGQAANWAAIVDMGGRHGRMAGPGVGTLRREEPQGRAAAGAHPQHGDDVGSQDGAGGREDMIGHVARAAQDESRIAVQWIGREGDDLIEVGARRHHAGRGL